MTPPAPQDRVTPQDVVTPHALSRPAHEPGQPPLELVEVTPVPVPERALGVGSAPALRRAEAAEGIGATVGATDRRLCRAFIARHSKSFYLSSLLMPGARRVEAWALYAFCRQADDSVDGDNPGDGSVPLGAPTETAVMLRAVEGLRRRLARVYRGELGTGPEHAIDRAFYAVAARTGLPQAVPARLLDGMEQDARGTRYRRYEELLGYCFNVAATVGLMMTYVMGHRMPQEREHEVLLRAADLGVAMQLSNIARDVGEDARRGRVYLPDDLLAACGTSHDEVLRIGGRAEPPPPELRRAVRELLGRAEAHYHAAALGIPMLPRGCRLAIRSAQLIYSGIGDRLQAQGYDAVTRRAYVPLGAKLLRVLQALVVGWLPVQRRLPAHATQGPADALLLGLCREVGVLVPGAAVLPAAAQRALPASPSAAAGAKMERAGSA
ncbi:MAG: phytoene/squalene synthase family protein [Polyangia bacterium]